jgi:hypothetical protein
LWDQIGAIGEAQGLKWGGRFTHPDRPHFEFEAAPLQDLKDFYNNAIAAGKSGWDAIMPIAVSPAGSAIVVILAVFAFYWFIVRPRMSIHGFL